MYPEIRIVYKDAKKRFVKPTQTVLWVDAFIFAFALLTWTLNAFLLGGVML